MLTYEDFYDIAVYGNENWKGCFTQKEIACNAYNYYSDFKWSIRNYEIAYSIKELCKNLADDLKETPDLEEPKYWLLEILYLLTRELGMKWLRQIVKELGMSLSQLNMDGLRKPNKN